MKKTLTAVLAALMVLSLAACGQKTETATAETEPVVEGAMTGAEFTAADVDTEVKILTYVQAHQSWWEDQVTVYSQTKDGTGIFLYNMACSEEDAEKLVPGTAIVVTGYKSEWSGEVEITDATFEFIDAPSYIAEAKSMTGVSADDFADYMNTFVKFEGLEVTAYNDAAFSYNWDGSGDHDSNSDLYFNVSDGTNEYTFTVESYLCDNSTDVYKTVEGLNIGDKVDIEGFMYWYEGPQVHVTSVTVK